MKILFLTKGDITVASSRFRVFQIAKKIGIDHAILYNLASPFFSLRPQRFRNFVNTWKEISKADVLFVHKSFFAVEIILLILVQRKKVIFDLDDAEWIHTPLRSRLLAKRADRVFAGSHVIMEWADQYNKRVILTPTVVDVEVYKSNTVDHSKRPVTIGWIGQGRPHYKVGNFNLIKDVLTRLHNSGKQFQFVIIGSQDYKPLKNLFSKAPYKVFFIDDADWTKAETSSELIGEHNIQIGLMPLENSPFNTAKCALKAIEYMACGAVAVSSNIGEANHLIKNKEDGYLVGGDDEWLGALSLLVDDEKKRVEVSSLGQKKIASRYALDYEVNIIKEELQTLVK